MGSASEQAICVGTVARDTHRRYTVRPTAVPIRAALNAVETIDPASVLRRLGAGRSICTLKVSVMVIVDHTKVWMRSIL